MNTKVSKAVAPILVAVACYLMPTPEGLSPSAWLYVSIFLGVVVGLILEPIPGAFMGLLGVVVACALKVGPRMAADGTVSAGGALSWALSGFSNNVAWLVLIAFHFAYGYAKTGLGRRVALILVKHLGKTSLGLGYAIILSDALLAPFMPSNTARSGGTIYPIFANIPPLFDSGPDKEPRKLGSYLAWVAFAGTCITSSMFLTGMATNLLFVGMASGAGYATISWGQWFMAFLPVGILLILTTPLLTYLIYPPALKRSEESPRWAAAELDKMGPISLGEKKMLGIAFAAIFLWIGAGYFKIDATATGLVALCLMLLSGVASWDEIVSNKNAWNAFIWFGALITLATGLSNTGFLAWFAKNTATFLGQGDPLFLLVALVVAFYALHYFFASVAAHVTALLPLFLATAAAIPGMDMSLFVLVTALSIGIMGVITPYGTGPAPVWASCGYIKPAAFWGLGFVFGSYFLIVFLSVGLPWISLIM